MTNETPDRDDLMAEHFLGQIKIDGAWQDYARSDFYTARAWATADAKNRRVVDWIYKEKILVPASPGDLPFTARALRLPPEAYQWKSADVRDAAHKISKLAADLEHWDSRLGLASDDEKAYEAAYEQAERVLTELAVAYRDLGLALGDAGVSRLPIDSTRMPTADNDKN